MERFIDRPAGDKEASIKAITLEEVDRLGASSIPSVFRDTDRMEGYFIRFSNRPQIVLDLSLDSNESSIREAIARMLCP